MNNTPPDKLPFLTVSEVAKRAGLSSETVRRAIKDGDIEAIKLYGMWAIMPDSTLAKWMTDIQPWLLRKSGETSGPFPDSWQWLGEANAPKEDGA